MRQEEVVVKTAFDVWFFSLKKKCCGNFHRERNICVKGKGQKQENKKKIRTENVGARKHWEVLFIKVINRYFEASLPVAHAPARWWKAWIQTAGTASNLWDGKKRERERKICLKKEWKVLADILTSWYMYA